MRVEDDWDRENDWDWEQRGDGDIFVEDDEDAIDNGDEDRGLDSDELWSASAFEALSDATSLALLTVTMRTDSILRQFKILNAEEQRNAHKQKQREAQKEVFCSQEDGAGDRTGAREGGRERSRHTTCRCRGGELAEGVSGDEEEEDRRGAASRIVQQPSGSGQVDPQKPWSKSQRSKSSDSARSRSRNEMQSQSQQNASANDGMSWDKSDSPKGSVMLDGWTVCFERLVLVSALLYNETEGQTELNIRLCLTDPAPLPLSPPSFPSLPLLFVSLSCLMCRHSASPGSCSASTHFGRAEM